MSWVEIMPKFDSVFRRLGWDSAAPFLSWTGILVNQHRSRSVEEVLLPSGAETPRTFFLKKETRVTWRDRLHNAWHGFGWCATAVREAAMLQALRQAGIGCPEVVALGEEGRSAFMLTRAESALSELREFLASAAESDGVRIAVALGRTLAQMHDAGFEHPDLFAKHILVERANDSYRFCILDWQRGRRRRVVSWRIRCRDLATLDATLHAALARDRVRLRVLHAYCRALTARDHPPLRRLAVEIRRLASRRLQNRNVREIGGLPIPPGDQQFVPAENGRLFVVRSFFKQWLSEPEALAKFSSPILATASGSEMPPLAHTLFHLQRFGIAAPRLLAIRFDDSGAVAFVRKPASIPLGEAFVKVSLRLRCRILRQAGCLVRKIHEAGYRLAAGDTWVRCLGVDANTGEVVLAQVDTLQRTTSTWRDLAPLELGHARLRLTRSEQLRFLSGYLNRRGRSVVRERQARA